MGFVLTTATPVCPASYSRLRRWRMRQVFYRATTAKFSYLRRNRRRAPRRNESAPTSKHAETEAAASMPMHRDASVSSGSPPARGKVHAFHCDAQHRNRQTKPTSKRGGYFIDIRHRRLRNFLRINPDRAVDTGFKNGRSPPMLITSTMQRRSPHERSHDASLSSTTPHKRLKSSPFSRLSQRESNRRSHRQGVPNSDNTAATVPSAQRSPPRRARRD